ncbi:MAG TPA: cellulose synthase family protein [Phycisphaerae bacterium]|nr:cellulose synthase family protein [Phycisphaerae bacterium]
MQEPTTWHYFLIYTHLAVCLVLAVYGVHRYSLVYLYYKYRRNNPRKTACFLGRPRVTIQLPMYNEQFVARRVIENACRIDYPRDRLEIQVLDDSTDETTEIARATCERMRAAGHDVVFLHRDNREGYKAGALAEGLKVATGEFIVIFDADFIPPTDILDHLIDHFVDPQIGMVQARWEHLNREQSLLTKSQAILLDGHFVIEHAARNRSGRFMSFNGTAGAWRRTCIADAGGWHHDTLTEDLDLSYRAQMKGWKFVYLPEVTSPAELPPEMNAFKSQQHRWAKGGAQTCRKLLPSIIRSRLPWRIKLEAFFHLTSWASYFLILVLSLLLLPVLYTKVHVFANHIVLRAIFDISLVLIATCSASTFYVASQREVFRTWGESLKYLPFLVSLGVGVSLNNARAAIEGLLGQSSEFVRTPKFGVAGRGDNGWVNKTGRNRLDAKRIQAWSELAMGLYLSGCVAYTVIEKMWIGLFFMCLFAVGYLYVAMLTFYGRYQAARTQDWSVDSAMEGTKQDLLPAPLPASK